MHSTHPEVIHAGQVIPASRFMPSPRLRPAITHSQDGGNHSEDAKLNSPPYSHQHPPEDSSLELAHDARNLISALDLYCQLLASPGVLAPGFSCYADDLRNLASNGARLIAALAGSRASSLSRSVSSEDPSEVDALPFPRRPFPDIEDVGSELDALEGTLRALAGPDVRLEVESRPCAGRLALNSEELLRILFNLVANAVEAMASTPAERRRRPFLRITAQRGGAASFLAQGRHSAPETVILSVRDNGPGIAAHHQARIFDPGFSTRANQDWGTGDAADGVDASDEDPGDLPRGLGLAIVHRLVTAAGGTVRVVSPAGLGARFDIELPVLPPKAREAGRELAAPLVKRKVRYLQQIPAQIEKEA